MPHRPEGGLAARADSAFLLCVAQAGPSKPCPVLFLPDDAVRLVELYLPLEDVISFSSTCRSLRWRAEQSFEGVRCLSGAFARPARVLANIHRFPNLETLDLSGNSLAGHGAALGRALSRAPPSLRRVSIAKNYLGLEGVRDMCRALRASASLAPLVGLDLSDNDMGREGAEEVAETILRCPALHHLRELSLAGNNIGLKGAAYIAKAMQEGGELRAGCDHAVQGAWLTDSPDAALREVRILSLARNGFFGVEAMKKLRLAWETRACPDLESLDLSDTCIFSGGAKELAAVLRRLVPSAPHAEAKEASINLPAAPSGLPSTCSTFSWRRLRWTAAECGRSWMPSSPRTGPRRSSPC
jgi:hypothetical protein